MKNKNIDIDSVFGEISPSIKIQGDIEEHKVSNNVSKKVRVINKNKRFLSLVSLWEIKILTTAFNLTQFVGDDEKRLKFKKVLQEKIDRFRGDKIPLGNQPKYSL